MPDHQTHHYSPSSVGALMDTAFLRSVMIDANGDRRRESPAPSALRLRWQSAMHSLAVALRRH
jgi:hypothetical protein